MGHYINNREFSTSLSAWIYARRAAVKAGQPIPRIPEDVGQGILTIATKYTNKASFYGYTYKEDMCADAVENALRYLHNFNPDKSQNGFAYVTQIVHNAVIRSIEKEHKQSYIRHKLLRETAPKHVDLALTDEAIERFERKVAAKSEQSKQSRLRILASPVEKPESKRRGRKPKAVLVAA